MWSFLDLFTGFGFGSVFGFFVCLILLIFSEESERKQRMVERIRQLENNIRLDNEDNCIGELNEP